MRLTVSQLRSWTPSALEAAAADFRRAHERVADAGRDLDCAVRMINSGWEGDASTAAGASIRTRFMAQARPCLAHQ